MFTEREGNIFSNKSGIIMHGCNCFGKMGAGVALHVRNKYPTAFREYAKVCKGTDYSYELLGMVHCIKVTDDLYIANCFTQYHLGPDARASCIKSALEDTLAFATENGIKEVHSVQIGCGIGGLSWEHEVREIYENASAEFPDVHLNVWSL
jgi:O-acetyl-ADP-ribose deacetylase (regulator of RNase III)